ncbi:uncharacterized protein RSE6_09034 [Rhynchosporium secalis]|uniref:Uncharacterized protein n=1 Tax=Rhynchosporium secalis TaxID=38038 RepID=A0A1E1MGZ0_RHYSE|nr:uncharacterized protein RSE6_09034 [Rhynchosporium secalis]
MIESRPAKLRTKALNRATTRQDAFVFSLTKTAEKAGDRNFLESPIRNKYRQVLMNALTQKIFPPVCDEAIK